MSPVRLLLPLLAVLAALCAAPAAHAATASVGGGVLSVTAGDGEANRLAIAYTGTNGVFTVTETGTLVTLRPGQQCAQTAANVLRCNGVSSIALDAGDGADTVTLGATVGIPTSLTDGAGDDTVTGGGGKDVFNGSPGNDTLIGQNGDDTFGDAGGLGADTLDGGAGTDAASYTYRSVPLSVVLDGVANDGAAAEGDDVRANVEQLLGGAAGDHLTGGPGNELLRGNGGDDVLDGGTGADKLEGNGGRDLADYRHRTTRVVVNATDNVANDGSSGEGDTVFTDVEGILGGSANDDLTAGNGAGSLGGGDGDDTLRGGGGDDAVDGGAGDDTLFGGDGHDTLDGGTGADELDGQNGSDVVDYSARTAPLNVDLAAGTTSADGDDLTAVEGVLGGSGADRLRGDDGDGRLEGGAGDDVIDGRGGADRMSGGPGRDHVDYGSRRSSVTVYLDEGANDGADGERDLVGKDFEQITTGAGADRIGGDEDGELIAAGAGDDTVSGNAGDDVLEGGDGKDQLWPGKGHDTARGGAHNDRIGGDDGNDTLDGGSGDDKVEGDKGDDVVVGGDNDDQIGGGDGNDVLDGQNGNDSVSGGAGDDRLEGGAGNDNVWPHKGNDIAGGGTGNDKVQGDDGNDTLGGGDGNDTVDGQNGDDLVSGGAGNDSVSGNEGADRVDGGDGDDKAYGHNGDDVVEGGEGNDQAWGGGGNDTVGGSGGDDKAGGDDGNDVVDAGPGADTAEGSRGDDLVSGGDGPDKVWGGDGVDRLSGGADDDELGGGGGDDLLLADPGADRVRGEAGDDTADYSQRVAPLRITNDGKADDGENGEGDNVDGSTEHVIGGAGNDLLRFKTDASHRLYGEGGNDTLDGGPKNDQLLGGPGNDQLIGRESVDLFDGGLGNDKLSGADGTTETLRCGAGKDSANRDRADKAVGCETTRIGSAKAPSAPAAQDTVPVAGPSGTLRGVRRVYSKGRFVAIPGSPGERIDRRLLKDIAYLKSRYKVAITDGYAMTGHSPGGEHPRGLAVDVIPGPGGSWSDIDRLARWAEPRQGRPRAPFRWVGYNGDAGHGRGHHLHLSWRSSGSRRGKPAKWVEVLSFKSGLPVRRIGDLTPLARRSNPSLGGAPSVRTGLRSLTRCRGAAQLVGTWKAAGRAFRINWKILAAITEIESGHGCNMGPSSAGALGWTQFMPATWKRWGMDADGNGKASPFSSADAIFSSARYLRATGAPKSYRKALFAYNHATWYVNDVLRRSKKY